MYEKDKINTSNFNQQPSTNYNLLNILLTKNQI